MIEGSWVLSTLRARYTPGEGRGCHCMRARVWRFLSKEQVWGGREALPGGELGEGAKSALGSSCCCMDMDSQTRGRVRERKEECP